MTGLPAPVESVCTTFLDAVPDGLVTGLYLHGGLAFGEWVEGKSDVDFTATLIRETSAEDLAGLADAHNNLAKLLALGGYINAALDHLTRAIDIRPDYPDAHYNLARTLVSIGRANEAAEHYRKALALRPDWAPALSEAAVPRLAAGLLRFARR